MEGEQAKISNLLGQKLLIDLESKEGHLVSCRQAIAHWLSSIFYLTALCLASEFKPLTFQHITFQFLHCLLIKTKHNKIHKPHRIQCHVSKRAHKSLTHKYYMEVFIIEHPTKGQIKSTFRGLPDPWRQSHTNHQS